MLSRIPLVAVLIACLALFGQQPAQAGDRDAVIAGAIIGGVVGGVIGANSYPVTVYAPPPHVVYYPPQPVYYPAYYAPYPVIIAPHYRYKHHRHHHRHHRHGGYYTGYRW